MRRTSRLFARLAVPAGQTLKTLRKVRNITVREVEQASRRIAEAKGDKRFCISNGWLAQLENGLSEPSIWTLSSLSVIYQTNLWDLLRLYNVDVDDKENYRLVADPNLTQLLSGKSEGNDHFQAGNELKPLYTSLLSELKMIGPEGAEPHIIYGYLGLTDFTMYPMIRPGALLKVDTSQNKLTTPAWRNEFERPIFFIELRDAYACGWCELQGNRLLIIPYHSCTASVRAFIYLREAEIVGRVIGYSTRCVDLDPP